MKKFREITPDGEKRVFLFLDFDGTLSPIVSHPKNAAIRPDAKKWLKTLLKKHSIKIAIVTGRSLTDIRDKIKLPELYYMANHGMEIFYKNRFLLKKGRQFEGPIKCFGGKITKALAHIPGVFIEEKGLSVAVHFRRVAKKHHGVVRKIIFEVAKPVTNKYDLQITEGKMILELRPASVWNKGSAVKWLLKKTASSFFPIYVGDDTTDEDAFRALKPNGLTIRIGMKTGSHAQYHIPSIKTLIESNIWRGVK